ncbi:UDP-glucose 4-epimerase GalE [Symmachiella macrocystis]|uniref:UDP-glucose 4-epimerase GalE n=1 Tax=Symmachiella macrocystis TaxID=2527985 RepID=UPI0018D30C2A|nr:UDP-glucose 4-epimerase GalE [Symmachiella macrocystis]
MSSAKTILVTGGAGYIGSVVVEQLVGEGARVVVFDNLSQGHRAAVHPDAVFVEGDLLDAEAIESTVAEYRPESVLHFAAHSLVGESMQVPLKYLGQNVTAGLNLFQTMVNHDVRQLILSSTANLFGDPEEIPISESTKIAPGSAYGESKYILERMLAWLEQIHGLRYAALRYFNAAGATAERGEDHTPETHLIPLVLEVALGQRDQITVFGDDYPTEDGTCIRDYIHVSDLAQAHIRALDALAEGSRVYNLGNGNGFSVQDVIETAREVTGHPIPVVSGERRAGDPAILVADSQKIRAELDWKPQFPQLRDIMQTAWNWHQSHPNGYAE